MRMTLTYVPKVKGKWLKEPIVGGDAHFLPEGKTLCLCGQDILYMVAPGVLMPLQPVDRENGVLGLLENLCYECVYPSEERKEEYERRCKELLMERKKRRRRNRFLRNRRNGLPNHPIRKSRARGTKGKEAPEATFILDKRSIEARGVGIRVRKKGKE